MSDEVIEANLAAYVDGMLSPEESRRIEQHLASNDRYRRMVVEMRQARQWLRSLPRVTPPGGADAILAADPTVARLERAALLGEDEPEPATGWEAWRLRLTSPHAMGIAASLAVLLTLAIAAYYLLPGSDAGQNLDRIAVNVGGGQNGRNADETADNNERPAVEEEAMAGNGEEDSALVLRKTGPANRVDPDDLMADPGDGATDLATPEEDPLDLPYLDDGAVVLTATLPDLELGVGRITATVARNGTAVTTRFDAIQHLPPEMQRRLNRLGRDRTLPLPDPAIDQSDPSNVEPWAEVADIGPNAILIAEQVTRHELTDVMRAIGAEHWPLAVWTRRPTAINRGDWTRSTRGSLRLRDLESMPPDQRSQRQSEEDEAEAADAEAARRLFPNDRLTINFRRNNELPPSLPESLNEQLTPETSSLVLPIDADGYMDLTPLGMERMDVLGMSPREVADEISQRLAFDYLISADVSAVTSTKAEIPGGRGAAMLDLLKIDRNPFDTGDVVRVEFVDGTRLESLVAEDGTTTLGVLGTFDAAGRTAGNLQRDIVSVLNRPEFETILPEDDEGPPAVVNVSSRRSANQDDSADDEIPLVIVLRTPEAPEPTTQPATQPATQPGSAFDLDFGADPTTRPLNSPTTQPSTRPGMTDWLFE